MGRFQGSYDDWLKSQEIKENKKAQDSTVDKAVKAVADTAKKATSARADLEADKQTNRDAARDAERQGQVREDQQLSEKWGTETKVSPQEKGKYAGKSKAELQKQYNALKARGPHKKGSPDFGKMRELAFAIRAKSDWGKVSEDPNEGNEFSGELAKARAAGKKEFEVDGKEYPVKEAAAKKAKSPWPGSAEYKEKFGQDRESFRKKHAPSVMKDPKGREELAKLDTEYEVGKKSYGRDEESNDDEEGSKKAKPAGEKRGRGRPKGSRKAIGAKGPTGRSKLLTREDYDQDEYDEEGEMAQSQSRTIADAAEELQSMLAADENLPEWVQKKISLAQEYIDSARDYLKSNRPEQDMDESALQAYLGKKKYGAAGMKALQQAGRHGASNEKMAKIRAQHDKLDEVDLEEKAVSKAQRAAAGIARAAQKGEIPRSELRGASKAMAKMPAGELRKFAKTKEKGLPEKVREGDIDPNRHPQTRDYGRGEEDSKAERAGKKVTKDIEYDEKVKDKIRGKRRGSEDDKAERAGKKVTKDIEHDEKVAETTTAGSVATAPAAGGKKSKGGIQFGKGIYDSMNREVEAMIAESMNVSINMNTDANGGPSRSVTVTATDEDAEKLASLLRMAGLGQDGDSVGGPSNCPGCGKAPCGCSEQVDENQPDWPTETETSDDALQYSGGLNKPKATGQTTVPVIASQDDRQHAYEGDDELRRLRERAGIFAEAKKKPDFLDMDKDGDKSEPMSKAIKDKESKVDEAIEGSLWNLYKRLQ